MNVNWIYLLFLFEFINSKQIYRCDQTLPKGICSRQSPDNIVLLKQCTDVVKNFCPLLMDGTNDDNCESPENGLNKYPGELCIAATECISQKCIQLGSAKVCASTSSPGSACAEDRDCDVKYSCVYDKNTNLGTCTAQLNKNDNNCGFSKYDQKCRNGLVCNLHTCVEPFSIDIGKQADNSMACKTFYNNYDSDNQQFICTNGTYFSQFPTHSIPMKCNNNCSYSINMTGKQIVLPEIPCDFSYTEDDISYCNPGKYQLQDQIVILKDYLNISNVSNKCHISSGFFCDFYNNSQTKFYKAYVAFMKLTKYNQVYNTTDCINNTINVKYIYALKHMNSAFSFSINFCLVLSSLFLMLLV